MAEVPGSAQDSGVETEGDQVSNLNLSPSVSIPSVKLRNIGLLW